MGVSLGAAGVVFQVEHRLRYAGELLDQRGTWYGGEVQARIGAVSAQITGLVGDLRGGDSVVNPSRSVRVTRVTLEVAPTSWLGFGVEAVARRTEAQGVAIGWRLAGPCARLTLPFGVEGLRGRIAAAYFPATSVSGSGPLSLALRGELGVTFDLPRAPLSARVVYTFERYDFGASAGVPARLEQVRGVLVGLGIRLGGQ